MLDKEYKEFSLSNGEKQISIVFKDNKYELLSTFLFIEMNAFEEWIKNDFDKVLSGQSEYEEINGNVCCVEISPNTTKIYDNLAEDAMGNRCEVDTKELRQLIEEYCDKVREFKPRFSEHLTIFE